jgi:phosphoribosylglycinamide formyltransferase-1
MTMTLLSPEHSVVVSRERRARVVVLASGSGSNFAALADAAADGSAPFAVRGLIYNVAGAGVAARASARGIPARLIAHQGFRSREEFDDAVVAGLRELEAEWVAMAGWMRIATTRLLGAFAGRILNLHPSLLPSFRGLRAVEQALAAGVKISGCTVHAVVPAVDEGPIVGQAAVPVLEGDDAASLGARIHAAEHLLYPVALARAIAAAG